MIYIMSDLLAEYIWVLAVGVPRDCISYALGTENERYYSEQHFVEHRGWNTLPDALLNILWTFIETLISYDRLSQNFSGSIATNVEQGARWAHWLRGWAGDSDRYKNRVYHGTEFLRHPFNWLPVRVKIARASTKSFAPAETSFLNRNYSVP